MRILVTGGAGYIGSHIVLELLKERHFVAVVDNFMNSDQALLRNVETLMQQSVPFYNVDIKDRVSLEKVFTDHEFDCCIHLASAKMAGASVLSPWEYYDNNVTGSLVLFDLMRKHNCKKIIFASSSAVYGETEKIPVSEDCPVGRCMNPYGWTKFMIEKILTDLYTADVRNNDPYPWKIIIFRYFNVVGDSSFGNFVNNTKIVHNDLFSAMAQVASGQLDALHIYGTDYDTPDGTCIRDYVHVQDVANAHVKALKTIENENGVAVYNLGTGHGYSIMEILQIFEKVNGVKVKFLKDKRRSGDVAVSCSDSSKAGLALKWSPEHDIYDICRSSRWN